MITNIKQVHVEIEDIDRAIAFYQDVLGLDLLMSFPDQDMAFFTCGESRLYLSKNTGSDHQSNPFIYYASDDIEADFKNLQEHNTEIIKEPGIIHRTETQESWLCAFKDTEGNMLHLMQDKTIN